MSDAYSHWLMLTSLAVVESLKLINGVQKRSMTGRIAARLDSKRPPIP